MYQTCMFCNKPLGTNEVVVEFPVGRLGGAGTGPHREAVTRRVGSLARRGSVWTAEAADSGAVRAADIVALSYRDVATTRLLPVGADGCVSPSGSPDQGDASSSSSAAPSCRNAKHLK